MVLLTSNNTRELTEALKRRCLYLWLDYPDLEHELQIVRLHVSRPRRGDRAQAVKIIHQVRELDLKKPPSIAESIDWARTLLLLGANDIDHETFIQTMSVIVKHRTDLDTVAARVGVALQHGRCRPAPRTPRSTAASPTSRPAASTASSCRSPRTSEPRASRSAPRRSSTRSRR